MPVHICFLTLYNEGLANLPEFLSNLLGFLQVNTHHVQLLSGLVKFAINSYLLFLSFLMLDLT